MIFKKEHDEFKLPKYPEPRTITALIKIPSEFTGYPLEFTCHPLVMVSKEHIDNQQKNILGRPVMFCLIPAERSIRIFPKPDSDYEGEISYCVRELI